jgi:hypothetical protein
VTPLSTMATLIYMVGCASALRNSPWDNAVVTPAPPGDGSVRGAVYEWG